MKFNNTQFEHIEIEGSGGKSGGRQAVEAPNTLQSRSTAKIVEVLSEGEVVGVVGGLKGVFFDDTPVQNADGSFNFPAVLFEERLGTPDQDYMPGFPDQENVSVVNTELTTAGVVRSVSSGGVDAVRVVVRLPNGLTSLDAQSGDLNGYRVGLTIETRPTGGTYTNIFSKTITGKTITPYEEAYRVEKPVTLAPGATWELRIRRTTTATGTATIQDRIDWFTMTEIQDLKITYDDAAVVGVAVDAESTGGKIPRRSYLMDGLIVKVPTNYMPATYQNGELLSYAAYFGSWDGTFKLAHTDDPAWILYDLLTNERYGMGEFINESEIDIYSFYDASVYNTERIDDGTGTGTLEPRFRMNTVLQTREDAYKAIQAVAATMRAVLFSGPGFLRLIQDRPVSSSAVITNANVINGAFNYTGTELASRATSVDVSFNDHADRYLPRTVNETAQPEFIEKYGFNKVELSALGVVHEGQARRLARWAMDSLLYTTDTVSFGVSWNNAFIEVGDVVDIYDNFYSMTEYSGVITGGSTTTITLDRPVVLQSGQSYSIRFMKFDGTEESRTVLNSAGTYTSLTIVSGTDLNNYKNSAWGLYGPVVPRKFKIMAVSETEVGQYAVSASLYDPSKYARVEQGVYVDTGPPTVGIGGFSIAAPTNVQVATETFINSQEDVTYRLRWSWNDVLDPLLKEYKVQYRRNNGAYMWSPPITQNEWRLDDAIPGTYEYNVYAYNTRGVQSPGAGGFYNLTLGDAGSIFEPVTSLRITNNPDMESLLFTGKVLSFRWSPPANFMTNQAVFNGYEVRIRDGSTVLHTHIGGQPFFSLSNEDIARWNDGVVPRDINVRVRVRDTLERFSAAVSKTFTNAAPATLTGVTAVPFFNYYQINHNPQTESDVIGVRVHHSTTSGFTPNEDNLVKEDVGVSHLIEAETDTTYFVRIAGYDDWSSTHLNYGGEVSVTTTSTEIGITPNPVGALTVTSSLITDPTGTQFPRIRISWNRSTNVSQYDLEIIATGTDAFFPTVSQPDTGNPVYYLDGVISQEYRVRVRSRAANNVSVWSSQVIHTAVGDTVPPATPTNFTLTPAYQGAVIRWTNPSAEDLDGIEIWRRPGGGSGSGVLVTAISSPLYTYYDTGLTINSPYQYRVRAFDRSGNLSGYTVWVTVNTINIPGNTVTNLEIMTGTIRANEIQANTITAGQIAANTITAGQIAANTITAGQITAGTITANEIAAGTITANNIMAGTITATQIATRSLTADRIQVGALTAVEIAVRTITADRIQVGAITATELTTDLLITTSAQIGSAVIGTAQIANAAIQSANIANAAITSAKFAGTIQSDNFTASAGWQIRRDTGSATFNNINARGDLLVGDAGTGFRVVQSTADPVYAIWAGSGTMNDTNAKFYLKKNGDAYFGGALSAGIVNTSTQSGGLTDAEIVLGPFTAMANKSATVIASLNANRQLIEHGTNEPCNAWTGGSNTITCILERSFNGSTWDAVTTQQFTFTVSSLYEPGLGCIYRLEGGGSFTTVDNTMTGGERLYRMRFTNWGYPLSPITTQKKFIQVIQE